MKKKKKGKLFSNYLSYINCILPLKMLKSEMQLITELFKLRNLWMSLVQALAQVMANFRVRTTK